jgi:hypothetical protein
VARNAKRPLDPTTTVVGPCISGGPVALCHL